LKGSLRADFRVQERDDLLDSAAAAWTALRWYRNEAEYVCTPDHDEKGLETTIPAAQSTVPTAATQAAFPLWGAASSLETPL